METNDGRPKGSTFTPMDCPRASEHLTPGAAAYAVATGRGAECLLCGYVPLRVVRAEPHTADDEAPSLESLNADTEPPEVTAPEDCRACTFGESMGHTCGRDD